MPIPLSAMVNVRAALSYAMRIFSSLSFSNSAASDKASKRSLSAASEALDINSRRQISLLLYKEWTIRCKSCLTSAWKPSVSFCVVVVVMKSSSCRQSKGDVAEIGLRIKISRGKLHFQHNKSHCQRLLIADGKMLKADAALIQQDLQFWSKIKHRLA